MLIDVETAPRTVIQIVPAMGTLEGEGFEVYRPFCGPVVDWVDPLLLLDGMTSPPSANPTCNEERP